MQAKKYADGNTVGEGDLRNFAGAIDAAGTTKGVFVTTAGFTSAAKNYVARSPKRIVLIDGRELARLMVAHDVGVRTLDRVKVQRIDEAYFDQGILVGQWFHLRERSHVRPRPPARKSPSATRTWLARMPLLSEAFGNTRERIT